MKGKRKIYSVLLLLPLLISQNVYAYNTLGYKWEKTTIKYYTTNGAIMGGAAAWTGLDASLQYSATYYDVLCEVVSSKDGWDGLTTCRNNSLYLSSAYMAINCGATKTWNNKDALRSVIVHEFGHVLGLNEVSKSRVIMNDSTWGDKSRYETYKLTTPQADDKNGINAIY